MKGRSIRTAAAVLGTAAIAACGGRSTEASAGAAADPVLNATGAIEYAGQFRPTQQSDGRVGMNTVQRIYGEIRVIFREATNRSMVTVSLNTQGQQTEVLSWAVAPGRCGSGSVPLLPASQFPPLEMSSTGRGEVRISDMSLAMPAGTYHANVYRGGETLTNVITCANLQMR